MRLGFKLCFYNPLGGKLEKTF